VLAVVRDRALPGYRTVYIGGFSALVALTGEEQEREVVKMCGAMETAHPELAKKHKKNLLKLAADATADEKALNQADTDAVHAFAAEVQARAALIAQLQRNEGALISLFPQDKACIRLYYRDGRRFQRSPHQRKRARPDREPDRRRGSAAALGPVCRELDA
jgi:hypothetical protein